jgi:hypothetical protein
MTDWPEYISHKIVRAAKIEHVNRVDGRITELLVRPTEGGDLESFMPTQAGMEFRVGVGDYAIMYPDGFRSVAPAKPFEEGYRRKE